MSYLRNGKRIYTAADKAKMAARRRNSPDPYLKTYRTADRQFALSEKNLQSTIAYLLRWNDVRRVAEVIREGERSIVQRRFEMFATMEAAHKHDWSIEGASASGDPEDRRVWLYYHQQEVKFYRVIAQRLGVVVA